MKKPVRVAVSGAAGQIGYSLVFRIASGEMLGKDQPIVLQLLERDAALRPSNAAAVADEFDRLAARLGDRWRLEERSSRTVLSPSSEHTLEAQWVQTSRLG